MIEIPYPSEYFKTLLIIKLLKQQIISVVRIECENLSNTMVTNVKKRACFLVSLSPDGY